MDYFYNSEIKKCVEDYMWGEYQRIKELDNQSDIEANFFLKFKSWDSGDCTFVGLLKVLLWYVASIENQDIWWQDEFKDVIDFLEK